MVELTGTPVKNTSYANGSQAVTIPADAEAVIVCSWGWESSHALDFSALSWDNSGLDFDLLVKNSSTSDSEDVWVRIMTNQSANWPGTGAKTLYWTFTSVPDEGGTIYIFFVKGLDTSDPVRDTDAVKATPGGTGGDWTSSLAGVEAGDLTIGIIADYYDHTVITADNNGQTVLASAANENSAEWAVAYKQGEDALNLVSVADDGWGYTGAVAFALKVATGGNHELTANGLSLGTPGLGSPTLSQAHALTASGLATGSPSLGTPALSQNVALSAQGLLLGAPVLGTPAVVQVHVLQAQGLSLGIPEPGSPALAQVHALLADALEIGAPILGLPQLAQNHLLAALDLLMGILELGTPALSSSLNYELVAEALLIGAPDLGSPLLGQDHVIVAEGLLLGTPALGAAQLSQNHVLTAEELLIGAPVLGIPALNPPPPVLAANVPGLKAGLDVRLRRLMRNKDPSFIYRDPQDLIERVRKLNRR